MATVEAALAVEALPRAVALPAVACVAAPIAIELAPLPNAFRPTEIVALFATPRPELVPIARALDEMGYRVQRVGG